MKNVNSSPQRNTFQKEGYVNRCREKGKEPLTEYLELFENIAKQDEENIMDPKWQQDNLEYDLRSTQWICDKVKYSVTYAQNLYAALCNNYFLKNDVWPILNEKYWSCSWRHAGGIIADMLQTGDYIDWYCSGITGPTDITEEEFNALDDAGKAYHKQVKSYVGEGFVTDEIKEDLHRLGWLVVPDNRGD